MKNKKLQKNNNSTSLTNNKQLIDITPSHPVINPKLSRYERLYKERSINLISDLLIVVGVMVLFVALIFFWNHPITSNRYIDLQISSNTECVSGDEAVYDIVWANNNRQAVEDAHLSLLPPVGFEILSVDASGFDYSKKTNQIIMNDLQPGANGKFSFVGKGWADIQTGSDWEIRLYYKNLGILHNKTVKNNFSYESSLLASQFKVPEKIYLKNNFSIELSLENNSSEVVEYTQVDLQFPTDFIITKTNLPIVDEKKWIVRNLQPGKNKIINIYGRLESLDAPQAKFVIKTDLIKNGNNLQQAWQLATSDFVLPKVDLDLSLGVNETYKVDEQYKAQLYYYNYENFSLDDVQIKFYSDNNGLQAKFSPDNYYYKNIAVEQEDFLVNNFYITTTNGISDGSVNIWAELSWLDSMGEKPIRRYVFSPVKEINVLPNINLSAKLYYFTPSGDQIGYGPLPPVVNEATSYWISLRLWPSFGEATDLVLTADFGDNVSLLDYNSSLGNINNENGINWQIGDYDSTWQYKPQPRLNIQLETIPSESQLDNNIILLKNIKAEAINKQTGERMITNIELINNDMTGDVFWANNGKVSNW